MMIDEYDLKLCQLSMTSWQQIKNEFRRLREIS